MSGRWPAEFRFSRRLLVENPGTLATVQDLGRPGFASIGIGTSGAADRGSLRLANRLVGNHEGAAAVEVTWGGFSARARGELRVAVTGAPCGITIGRAEGEMNTVLTVPAGATLRLCRREIGVRTYIAVAGGIDVPPVLGSRSTDLLSALGPDPLRPGTELPIGPAPPAPPPVDFTPPAIPAGDELTLRVIAGPRHEWFTETALKTLLTSPYTVTTESNRIGIRLDGPPLAHREKWEAGSDAVVPGCLQVPPSGRPTLVLADHPATGGYPVIAVVVSSDVDKAAQARPGMRIRFSLLS
ncbi:biotin-dependent carboxyltransferase family protein [Amycolatopsis taiwanensis]|nr:biotin-dependent carboxyltransferase family protein [Amycolatopsis taiwanensis]